MNHLPQLASPEVAGGNGPVDYTVVVWDPSGQPAQTVSLVEECGAKPLALHDLSSLDAIHCS